MQLSKALTASMAAVLIGFSSPAWSILMTSSGVSTSSLGNFEAELNWDDSQLNISLTNTSNPSNGGFITGFLINLPSGASFNVGWTDTGLQFLSSADGPYNGAPYGGFDVGYAAGGNYLGGGNPSVGIGVGDIGHFTLSDWQTTDGMSIADMIDDLDNNFIVRFRGFNNGGSDKVVGSFPPPPDEPPSDTPPGDLPPPPPSAEVPVPSSLLLFLLALPLLIGAFRRKNKHSS